MAQMEARGQNHVIFVDSAASSHNRRRLVEHNVPFVIPGNQMYLPGLGIDFREHFKQLRRKRPTLSPSTQAVVLYAIYHAEGRALGPSDTAQRLGYTAMTMSRAFDELEGIGVGEHSVKGKERCLQLAESRRKLWEDTLPFMRSPTRKALHILGVGKSAQGVTAGLTALARYSMLVEPENPVLAYHPDEWKAYARQHSYQALAGPEPGSTEIQLWTYSPVLFAQDGLADRLSLYLSLKDTTDERIESALEEMIEGMRW
jgi:DNA-binding MarR family transcriptional regulator